jgi:hypothetical protein
MGGWVDPEKVTVPEVGNEGGAWVKGYLIQAEAMGTELFGFELFFFC